eukprot:CAMPEP_0183418730 /NCGR_PEP_ID=MMETSP0370-20130417/25302_1 /TAXON_ID=268820 /ORGANISM="Peridinium aciculiferum, Strain PAER-2" /LENGTH=44 /DNA_ID= /DNA_START= /DNA_END= /DNA_ORIENTATION=
MGQRIAINTEEGTLREAQIYVSACLDGRNAGAMPVVVRPWHALT